MQSSDFEEYDFDPDQVDHKHICKQCGAYYYHKDSNCIDLYQQRSGYCINHNKDNTLSDPQ